MIFFFFGTSIFIYLFGCRENTGIEKKLGLLAPRDGAVLLSI